MPSHRTLIGLVCLVVFLVSCRALRAWAATPAPAHAFVVTFGPATKKHQRYKNLVQSSGRFQDVARELNEVFVLPADVEIAFEEGDGPLYDPETHVITMPWDFVASAARIFVDEGQDQTSEEIADNILGVTEFVLYHEMGHALIDLYDLPVTGKEEDSVDSLAVVMAVITERQEIALAGVDLFNAWAANRQELTEEDFWDEHSLDEQRTYSVICWLYGSDPKVFKDLAQAVELPEDRQDFCQEDWQKQYRSWSKLLVSHLRK